MTCPKCHGEPKSKPCGACGKLPPVLQINNEECPVLFHTIEVGGTIESNPPAIGKYRNVLAVYKEDETKVLYNSDGVPSNLGNGKGVSDFDQLYNRPKYANEEMTSDTDIPDVNAAVSELDNSLATVAKTGNYSDLTGTPTIPTKTSELVNDGSDDTSTYVEADELATVATSGSYTDLIDTPAIDAALSTSSENAVQNKVVSGALDRSVDTGIIVDDNPSTTVLQLKESQVNLMSGASVTNNIPLPVASTTQAGVMNSATFDAVTNNTSNINALINGAVAVTGLSASATQSELTTAWQTATGLTTLMNRAGIYDVTNNKVWTYYTNDTTWHAATNTTQVTINNFTNAAAGIIKGSTTNGQVFAENDGTGSVNGWDTLSGQVGTNTSKLSTIAQGAEVNVQSNWTEADNTSDAYILNKPNLATVATSGAYSDLSGTPTVDTTLSSTSTNAVENQAIDAEFDKVAYAGSTISTTTPNIISTSMIQDNAVTTAKLGNDINFLKLTMSTTDIGEGATLAADTLYGVYE